MSQYLDRNKAPYSTKTLRPVVEDIAEYIHEKNHPLKRENFEQETDYFPSMIEGYLKV